MLNLANSINRLNLLVQQSKLSESLQQTSQPSRIRQIQGTPQTVYIGDLPKELSLVELYEFLKENVGDCEVIMKRPALKYFYYAFCRFPDIIQARKLLQEIKFPEMHGKVCRALPYDKELLRNCTPKSNLFVKGFGAHWSHRDLYEQFVKYGAIVSARVSIKNDYESRGYGFVQFQDATNATKACQEMDGKEISLQNGQKFTINVCDFVSKSERVPKDSPEQFNNLFVKNFPNNFTEEDLCSKFAQFGELQSVKLDQSGKFGFVAFTQSESAQAALNHFNKEDENQELLVAKCMKRGERDQVLKKEHMKKMRDLARNNLFFKGFPTDMITPKEELEQELTEFFSKFGEVKNLFLPVRHQTVDGQPKQTLLGFGFCTYQTLESAQKCRFDIQKELFRNIHKIYANPFEWKDLRSSHKMERIDQFELQRYLQLQHQRKARDVIADVKEDLSSEQGQLLLRVLTTITKVQQEQLRRREDRRRSKSREQEQPAPMPQPPQVEESKEAQLQQQQQVPQMTRLEREQQMLNQAYEVRFQTVITGADYNRSDDNTKKQLLGTFIYDHVKFFLDQALRGLIPINGGQDFTPKVTGMIMSLPLQHLTIGISTYAGLFQKVKEALALLLRNRQPMQ